MLFIPNEVVIWIFVINQHAVRDYCIGVGKCMRPLLAPLHKFHCWSIVVGPVDRLWSFSVGHMFDQCQHANMGALPKALTFTQSCYLVKLASSIGYTGKQEPGTFCICWSIVVGLVYRLWSFSVGHMFDQCQHPNMGALPKELTFTQSCYLV